MILAHFTRVPRASTTFLIVLLLTIIAALAPARAADPLRTEVDAAVRPVMARYAIPGMVIAVTHDGHDAVFIYGLADPATH